MELILKKNKEGSLNTHYTVAVSSQTKEKIERIKRERHVDVNEMLRQFMQNLIKQFES